MAESWRPQATPDALRLRARLLETARQFFARRQVLEVETPVIVQSTVSDPHTDSLPVTMDHTTGWLRTSPEYHMKRMLAAGFGDIYQLGKVFRQDERGALHQPEFTMLEWYRLDFTIEEMIAECCELIAELASTAGMELDKPTITTYREAFLHACDLDPLAADLAEVKRCVAQHPAISLDRDTAVAIENDKAAWLDLLAGMVVFPTAGNGALQVVKNYPADQAMLARLSPKNPATAERFEVFLNGTELANGYRELTASDEQAKRFATDNKQRAKLGKEPIAVDTHLLAALADGLPECSGVAVGFDRVMMLASGSDDLETTVSFNPLT